jgi:hypothetical protein
MSTLAAIVARAPFPGWLAGTARVPWGVSAFIVAGGDEILAVSAFHAPLDVGEGGADLLI